MKRKLFFGIGFLIWLLATVSFRLAGHVFFRDEEPAILALIWLVTLIAMLGLALLIFRWQGLNRAGRFEAAVWLVISGMVLDAFVTEGFAGFFPNMPASAASSFGAWLLLAYASVLLAAIIPQRND